MIPKIAWSKFAVRNAFGRWSGPFSGTAEELLTLVRQNWKNRIPGTGRKTLSQVVIVPMKKKDLRLFRNRWTWVMNAKYVHGKVVRRQPEEDPFVRLTGKGTSLPTRSARVVLYSATTLEQDKGHRSSDAAWEIVAILTGPWAKAPMEPLTMARNFLRKPGGTRTRYSARQFAESIYFWSQFIERREPA
jgi:hypothetical protein